MEDENKILTWNLSSYLINQVGMLLQNAVSNYVRGNLPVAYRYLKGVKLSCVQELKKEQRDELERLETKTAISISQWKSCKDKRLNGKLYQIACANYEELNTYLMDSLEGVGFLIKKSGDPTKMAF